MTAVRSNLDFLEFLYEVRNGTLSLVDMEDGRTLVGTGYSGKGIYRDLPEAQDRRAFGPIPSGMWLLGARVRHPVLGPCSIPLTPIEGNTAFGRSGFYIHGDSKSQPGRASTGCIILPPDVREWIASSGVRRLQVIAG